MIKNPCNNNFLVRTLSGAVYVALLLVTVLVSTPWLLFALFSFLIGVGIVEFNLLTRVNRTRPFRVVLDIVAGIWLLYACMQYAALQYSAMIFAPYVVYVLYIMARSIFAEPSRLLLNISNSLSTQIIIAIPLAAGGILSFTPSGQFNGLFLLGLYILIWVNDTGAFLVGMWCGKHLMYPAVSPHKTLEGLAGGLFLATLFAAFVLPLLAPFQGYNIWLLALLGLFIGTMATIGDLFESVLKRNAGVKDSGHLIPGHGGILDRIDSLLFALPVFFLLIQLFRAIP